jgi:hypothetical protein
MNNTPEKALFLVNGMQTSILAFEKGELSIDRLAWELKSRISALRDTTDIAWVDELKEIWNQLEVVNAFFIESGREDLNADEKKEIREILDELSVAIARYLYATAAVGSDRLDFCESGAIETVTSASNTH